MKQYLFFIFFIIFNSCQNNDLKEFKITEMNQQGIYMEEQIDSKILKENIEIVLKTYKIN